MRSAAAFLASLALLAPGAAAQPRTSPATQPAQPALTLDALMARFAALPGLSARFREEKRMALLAAPLVTEGTLYYAPRARLARHTSSPAETAVLIDGASLRFRDEHGQQSMDLDANPTVRAFVSGFVDIFAGNRAGLERVWVTAFRVPDPRAPERWELTLRPRGAPIDRALREVSVRGAGVTLERLTVVETSGDESVTVFSDVAPGRRFTPAELDRYFRLPAGR